MTELLAYKVALGVAVVLNIVFITGCELLNRSCEKWRMLCEEQNGVLLQWRKGFHELWLARALGTIELEEGESTTLGGVAMPIIDRGTVH